jgi:glycosyltransferase involved in cell wall biosynthesis
VRLVVVWHGAVVRAARSFIRELARKPGVELTLIAPTRWSRALPRPIRFEVSVEPFEVLLFHPFFPWHGATLFSPRIGALLRRVSPDAILAVEEPYSLILGQIARWKSRSPATPLLACYSYQNIEKQYPFPFRAVERMVFRTLDVFIGANPEVVDVARRKGFSGRAEVIPTAVDVDLFRGAGQRGESARRVTGLRIGYVGRLVEEKGIDTLIQAIGRMTQPSHLVLVGSGPEEARLRELAAPLGDRVHFAGPVSGDEAAEVYPRLDVLVLPSRTRPNWKEQFGRVLAEAMASEVPVVGSISGAIPWVIGDAGLLFSEGNAAELASRLDFLHEHPEERVSLGRKGRARAKSEFSAPVVADRLYRLLSVLRPPQTA